jgi:hypothetical protein
MKKLILVSLLVTLCVQSVGFAKNEKKEQTLKQKLALFVEGLVGLAISGIVLYKTHLLCSEGIVCMNTLAYIADEMNTKWPEEIRKYLVNCEANNRKIYYNGNYLLAKNKRVISYEIAYKILDSDDCQNVSYFNFLYKVDLIKKKSNIAAKLTAVFLFVGVFIGTGIYCKFMEDIGRKLNYYRKKNKEEITS